MSLESFPFIHHKVNAAYPLRSSQVALGGGWTHTITPNTPPARTLTLKFNAMKYFVDDLGIAIPTTRPEINLLNMEKFYARHEMHKSFLYSHYIYGVIEVKFNKPFATPDLLERGNGVCKGFTLELKEQPK